MLNYINTNTGEKALLVYADNIGTELEVRARYIMLGARGRFFVEGEELVQWIKL